MLRSEGDRLKKAVVCTPAREYYRVGGRALHNIHEAADPVLALAQHDQLKAVLASAGCEVIDVQELAGHPNSVFTRDTAVCTPAGFVSLRMGLPSRRGEEEAVRHALASRKTNPSGVGRLASCSGLASWVEGDSPACYWRCGSESAVDERSKDSRSTCRRLEPSSWHLGRSRCWWVGSRGM